MQKNENRVPIPQDPQTGPEELHQILEAEKYRTSEAFPPEPVKGDVGLSTPEDAEVVIDNPNYKPG
ncbi:MAG: hypothetical protein CMK06_11170 [Ponticaulis sp.]|nr:hypothetical protein [Ponticaulis sp.]|tara:strand:+ start:22981 stop:23178 length:198 start_codon:yes stop_codon:yes gene_type:complete